jgi:hypothetical protein
MLQEASHVASDNCRAGEYASDQEFGPLSIITWHVHCLQTDSDVEYWRPLYSIETATIVLLGVFQLGQSPCEGVDRARVDCGFEE